MTTRPPQRISNRVTDFDAMMGKTLPRFRQRPRSAPDRRCSCQPAPIPAAQYRGQAGSVLEPCLHQPHALVDADQPEPGASLRISHIKAAPVVGDAQFKGAVVATPQGDLGATSIRVTRRIA